MDIIGFWRICAVNVFDQDFNQTWRTAEDILADSSVSPMQKAFAQGAYQFEADGTLLSLMPKQFAEPDSEPFNDEFIIAKRTQWKEENGTLYAAAEENGEPDWQEMVPAGDGFELFGFQRISR